MTAFTDRWADALESGTYLQGRRLLRSEDARGNVRHCVIGVACDLLIQDGVLPSWVKDGRRYKVKGMARLFIDRAAYEYMGIDGDTVTKLMQANDSGLPFPKLARRVRNAGRRDATTDA